MNLLLRKYLRNRVRRIRETMRANKEIGALYYINYNGMTVKWEPYHYHKRVLSECILVPDADYFNSVMSLIFLRFLRKETNKRVTRSMGKFLFKTYGCPYYMASSMFGNTEPEITNQWKQKLVELLEAENRKMRKGNRITRLLGIGRRIVKPSVNS